MNNKMLGVVMIVLGATFLLLGSLNVLGYINLQLIDYSPPEILFSFPASNMTYKASEISEIVIYARDSESGIASATYLDTSLATSIQLFPTSYTSLQHVMTIIYGGVKCKFPDVNFDGTVNQKDLDMIIDAYGTRLGDINWNSNLDVFPDNKIDGSDLGLCQKYIGTTVYAKKPYTSSYTMNSVIEFAFTVTNGYGYATVHSGKFNIIEYYYLEGFWFVNNFRLDSSRTEIFVEEKTITVEFVKKDSSISDYMVKAKVIYEGKEYMLQYIGNSTWRITIEMKNEKNSLTLYASSESYMNILQVSIILPSKTLSLSLGHVFLILGTAMFLTGTVLFIKEKEKMRW